MTNISKNIQDNNIQQPQDNTQPPAKAMLNQPQMPKQQHTFGKRFFRWYIRFCKTMGKALLIALLFRFLFELAPTMQEKLPKLYQVYSWVANFAEKLFEFVFGIVGSLFRGELGTFFPQVWEGIKELFNALIALF